MGKRRKKDDGGEGDEEELVDCYLRRDDVPNGYRKIRIKKADIEKVTQINNSTRNDIRRDNRHRKRSSPLDVETLGKCDAETVPREIHGGGRARPAHG